MCYDFFMDKFGRLEKKYGQNFLTDTNLLRAIVADSGITSQDNVLEIGAGAGALTKELAKAAKQVLSYEIDINLKDILDESLKDCSNVKVIFKDFMKVDEGEIADIQSSGYKVVANLPYYITTPIIFKLLDFERLPQSITIMVQEEVAQRITAKEGTEQYGALTVGVQSFWKASVTRKVRREMFTPRPNVDSCVVKLEYNPLYQVDREILRKVTKSAFHMRRKKLTNNLMQDFGLTREEAEALLIKLNLSVDIRGEMLSVEQFVKLAQIMQKG